MKNIQMVDLKGQYIKIQKEVDSAIQRVIQSTSFINGSAVKEFSSSLENYLTVANVIPCGNGTDALQIALMALGLKKGDEIICPDFTFVATAEVAELLGLKTVLVDVDPNSFMLNAATIEKAITSKTKAIVPVHLFGQCAPMEEILALAKSYNLFVIEDAAQSIGAEYTFFDGTVCKAGTMGNIGTTSFFPSKNLGCFGDGGAIFTNDDSLAKKCRTITNHGMNTQYLYDCVGVNSRLDTLQAAVLNVKLNYLDSYNEARLQAANYYDNAFVDCKELETPYRSKQSTHVFHQYTLKLAANINRHDLIAYMHEKGIPIKIYYPKPLHKFTPYTQKNYKDLDFKITNNLCDRIISLPMHTELDETTLEYISTALIVFFNNTRLT
jgi:UDP-2-acetamido-2-deoxy-ribo-hexuluronate aminotransferase